MEIQYNIIKPITEAQGEQVCDLYITYRKKQRQIEDGEFCVWLKKCVPHGSFIRIATKKFGVTRMTINKWMRAYKTFDPVKHEGKSYTQIAEDAGVDVRSPTERSNVTDRLHLPNGTPESHLPDKPEPEPDAGATPELPLAENDFPKTVTRNTQVCRTDTPTEVGHSDPPTEVARSEPPTEVGRNGPPTEDVCRYDTPKTVTRNNHSDKPEPEPEEKAIVPQSNHKDKVPPAPLAGIMFINELQAIREVLNETKWPKDIPIIISEEHSGMIKTELQSIKRRAKYFIKKVEELNEPRK